MSEVTTDSTRLSDGQRGFVFAFSAYLLWGLLPLYLKALGHIPAFEVLAHRIIWSIPIGALILICLGRVGDLRLALKNKRTLTMATVTAALISVNWGIYIWAVSSGHALQTALGYYINPLVNVLLGALFLGERLTKPQMAAVALACAAVVVLTVSAGELPWVSLALALSFGFYGFLRKTLPIGPSEGFMLEVLILAIPSALYIGWTILQGQSHMTGGSASDIGLLLFAGPATAIPLVLFASGAKLLRFTTIGLMQYMAPTIVFFIAIFLFGEPFSQVQLVAFVMIWVALAIYTWSMFRNTAR